MIDTLVAMRERIRRTDSPARFGLEPGTYLVVTLHRPALVDGPLLADTLAHLSTRRGRHRRGVPDPSPDPRSDATRRDWPRRASS